MRQLTIPAAVLTALLVPAASHAAKPWNAAETVSRAPGIPSVAIGPDKRAVVAWSANNAAYGARRTPGRGFGEPFALHKQRRAVGEATVTFDAAGNALFAFRRLIERNHRIAGATLRPRGSRTGPISLSGSGSSAYDPTFAAPAAGTLAARPTLTWWRRNRSVGLPPTRVQLARAVGGRLLASERDTIPNTSGARYAQASDGTVVAATTTSNSIVVAVRPPGASFAAPLTLDAGRGRFRDADVSLGRDGTVAVIWRRFTGSTYRLFASVLRAQGAFGAPVAVSGADERADKPRVLVTSAGAVRIAYLSTPPGNDRGSQAGRLRMVSLDGRPVTVTAGSQRAIEYELAGDGRGGATLAWTRRTGNSFGGAVYARAVTPSGRLGARQRLTRRGETARGMSLAVGTDGDAVLAWLTADARRLRAARRPASG